MDDLQELWQNLANSLWLHDKVSLSMKEEQAGPIGYEAAAKLWLHA